MAQLLSASHNASSQSYKVSMPLGLPEFTTSASPPQLVDPAPPPQSGGMPCASGSDMSSSAELQAGHLAIAPPRAPSTAENAVDQADDETGVSGSETSVPPAWFACQSAEMFRSSPPSKFAGSSNLSSLPLEGVSESHAFIAPPPHVASGASWDMQPYLQTE